MADRVKVAENNKKRLESRFRFANFIKPNEVYVYSYGDKKTVQEAPVAFHPGIGQFIDTNDMTYDLKEMKIQCANGVDAWRDVKVIVEPGLRKEHIEKINEIRLELSNLLSKHKKFIGNNVDIDVIRCLNKEVRRNSLGYYAGRWINGEKQLVDERNAIKSGNDSKDGPVASIVGGTLQSYSSSIPDDIAKYTNSYTAIKAYCDKNKIDEDTTKFYFDLDKIIEYTVRIKLFEKYGGNIKEYTYGTSHGEKTQEQIEQDKMYAEKKREVIELEGKNNLLEQDFKNQRNISEKEADVAIQKMQSDQDAYDIKAKGEAEASVIEQKLSVTDGRTEGEIDASLNNSNRPQKTIIEAESVTKSINDTIDHTSEEANKLIGLIYHTKENARKMDSEAEKTTDEELFNDKTDEHDLREYVEEPVTSTEEDKFERIKNEVVDEYIKNMNSKINSVPDESYDDSSLISEVSELPDEEETNTKDEGISYTKK